MPDLRGRGLYAILDSGHVPPHRVGAVAGALADAGCPIVQLRAKGDDDRTRLAAQRAAADALAGRGVWLCVNDRPDLARVLALEAPDGVGVALHLGQRDVPPALARRLVGEDVLIGLSTHSPEQVRAAADAPVDYLGFGPVFPTTTKARPDPTVGVAGLRAAAALSARPVVGIGGIAAAQVPAVLGAGAAFVALIGALYAGLDVTRDEDLRALTRRAAALHQAGGTP